MGRFTPDPFGFFETIYRDVAPWDIGRAQPAMVSLIEAYPPEEPVLDVGCGTGDLVLEIAHRGYRAIGLDFAERAVEVARAKAATAPAEVAARIEFRVGDALRPSLLPIEVGSIVDSGFFHVLEAKDRDAFLAELRTALRPGGRYYLLAFAVEFPMPNTPLRVTADELRTRFCEEEGWRIIELREAEFLSRMSPVPAIAGCIERVGGDHP
jgi:SAM-dependent methyltransferase